MLAGVAAGGLGIGGNPVATAARDCGIGDGRGQPAVAPLGHALERGLDVAADPDRQVASLRRLRLHRHGHRRIVIAVEGDVVVTPIAAEHVDGLVHAPAAIVEALFQGVVFGFLPANADAKPHPAARKGVKRADLLCHQHRLALRQHQHLGAKADAPGGGGDVGERHQRFQNRHLRRIHGRFPAVGGEAHDDVIEHVELVEADVLDGLGETQHRLAALAIGHARKLHRQFHAASRSV